MRWESHQEISIWNSQFWKIKLISYDIISNTGLVYGRRIINEIHFHQKQVKRIQENSSIDDFEKERDGQ